MKDIVVPTDVYGVTHLNPEARVLLRGQVTASLDPQAPAVVGAKNEPMMPLAWMRDYQVPGGKTGRAFCTTMGASIDLLSEDLRRLLVNVVHEFAGKPVPARADVGVIDPYEPSFYGFVDNEAWVTRGLKPEDFAMGKTTRPFDRVVVPAGFKAPSPLLP